jgi:hypothetical protein
MVRHPRATEKPSGRSPLSSCRRSAGLPSAPVFQQVDFHSQLADPSLQLGNLAFVFGDASAVDYFIGELSGFVLPHPLAEKIA